MSWIRNGFLLAPSYLVAMWIGSPAAPLLQTQGCCFSSSWGSVRLGYLGDYVYQQTLQDALPSLPAPPDTKLQLSTEAVLLTGNLKERLDLFILLGGSKLQLDQEVFTSRVLSWGSGAKLHLGSLGPFSFGIDCKYFETTPSPLFFESEGLAYPVTSKTDLQYSEMQGALGISYLHQWIRPYLYVSYLLSYLIPSPALVVVRLPNEEEEADILLKRLKGRHQWGMTIGATIIDGNVLNLSIESRLFNQNAIDVSLDIRF